MDVAGHAECGCSERGALLGEAGYLWYKALGMNRGGCGVSIEDQRKFIDLTDPNLEGADVNDDSSSLHAPSLPPSSSEAEDDDFDIDAVVREEEKHLAAFRAQHSVSPEPPAPKAKYKVLPPEVADGMDIDEEAMWNDLEIFDDSIPNPSPPPESSKSSIVVDNQDEEIWDMVRELEREELRRVHSIETTSCVICFEYAFGRER
ncbi:uncharacterized protein F5891DRAFT_1237679 [Suillus fuscotomentosus]|uniref:Uncharacterized protein n=1 Tax=Suillus fuscotomentosus TaxID=1912939 RepID=A0AAD4E2J8_9AGAM|nr:uncharacterized protein F5891DRAFT_1237679 [Suillus fuscotomentosus]KAG1898521.1 hypothetical protein F5891DRAFT_1237679 [Suillus fuscotomentosus]